MFNNEALVKYTQRVRNYMHSNAREQIHEYFLFYCQFVNIGVCLHLP